MKPEIEVKFLNVNFDDVRAKLRAAGAELEQPMRLMRRVTIETIDLIQRNAYLRVRDEGNRVTMTYKQYDELSIDGAKEIEIEVGDFEQALALLSAAGLPYQSFQESRRETWRIGEAEIVLDEWPWLHPYVEIEAPSADTVRNVSEQLGFSMDHAVFGDVMVAYRAQYPHLSESDTVGRVKEVKFGDPLPDLLKPKP